MVSLLESFGIIDRVVGLSFDTTASNTGCEQGACVRIERHLKRSLLWLACRRHVLELHIKHVSKEVAENVSGRATSGPKNLLFKKLQENWPSLLEEIDIDDLNLFDWSKVRGTELEAQGQNALEVLSYFIENKTFHREDYRELCELAYVFLGGKVENFHFQYPGAYHHARYMAQAIYHLKMMLLMESIDWLSPEEER